MEDDPNGRQPKWKMTQMEDDPNGRRPKWKMTQMEDNPKWKTTQIEEDSNGRQAKWKTIPKVKTMFKTKDATPSMALLSPACFFIHFFWEFPFNNELLLHLSSC